MLRISHTHARVVLSVSYLCGHEQIAAAQNEVPAIAAAGARLRVQAGQSRVLGCQERGRWAPEARPGQQRAQPTQTGALLAQQGCSSALGLPGGALPARWHIGLLGLIAGRARRERQLQTDFQHLIWLHALHT